MGNSYQRDKNLSIYIQTTKPFYNSGSTIEGVVFVKAFKNFTFDALYIRVDGDEWCQWFEGSSKNRRKYTGNQNMYTVEHSLEKFKQKHLEKGQYAYPFVFQLSENIPGSFLPSSHDSRIEYKLSAYFVDYSNKESVQIQSIPLLIREPFRQQIIPYQGTVERSPKTCFCFDQGTVTIHAWFERNVAYQGQEIKVEVTADNKYGKKDLNTFYVELVQYTFVCANNGVSRTYTKTISSNKVNEHVAVGARKDFVYNLKIPSIDHQSAISTLVANYYRIQISSKSNGLFAEDPCIYAPIFLLKKDLKVESQKNEKKVPQQMKDLSKYRQNKPKFFSAPEYWFKKNKNLSVMNFKLEDQMGLSQDHF